MTKSFPIAPAFLALLALCGGGCEYFSMITVPAVDTLPPAAGTRYLASDGDDQIRFDGFVEVIHGDVHKNYLIAPFGFDPGGLQTLTVSRSGRRTCSEGGIGSVTTYTFFSQTRSGDEHVGQSAPDGRYVWFDFAPSDYVSEGDDCTVDMGWLIEATDYHGNTTSASGAIRYEP